jgi:hypothetical protein
MWNDKTMNVEMSNDKTSNDKMSNVKTSNDKMLNVKMSNDPCWTIIFLWAVFENVRNSQNILAAFFLVKNTYKFCPKLSWATFWVIFSRTYLATLFVMSAFSS